MSAVVSLSRVNWQGRMLGSVTAMLAVFGVAAVYGASSIVAVQSGEPGSAFALRQLVGIVVGGIGLLVAARLDYHVWQRLAWPLMLGTLAVLAIPYLPVVRALAPEIRHARRWLVVGPVSVQPSEFAKFVLIVWAAMLATRKGDGVRHFRNGVLPFLVIGVPLGTLILFQPNLSTAVLAALLLGIVMFAAGARIGHFLVLLVLAIPIVWQQLVSVQYRLARIVTFLSPGGEASETSWQIQQSLIGIGSGRLVGVGYGEGSQKLGFLPDASTDFIFSTIGEEWGFLGSVVILLAFGLYFWIGLRIARDAEDRFGALLAVGLVSLVVLTALLHIAVTLAIIPTTGLPLPFVSYGRSNLLVSLFATGVLINIGRSAARARR